MTVNKAKFVEVDETHDGQRIDNFLLAHFSKVPRSRIYRALRSGEVRVNKGRIKPTYRVRIGDIVRLPPIHSESNKQSVPHINKQQIEELEGSIISENENLLVINKPAGIAVHSGSGDRVGVIEIMRSSRQHQPFLELAHRIDKETSGCLMIAKSRRALLDIQNGLHLTNSQKDYVFLAEGLWKVKNQAVSHNLETQNEANSYPKVVVTDNGKSAQTVFTTREIIGQNSLISASILTGRTHQIRVHAQHEGHPIAGDKRYGNFEFNRCMQKNGLNRMFLHAEYLKLHLESFSQTVEFRAPLPDELKKLCRRLRKAVEKN